MTKRPSRRRRSRVPRLGARWVAAGLLAFVAFLYYRPLETYFETRAELERRSAEVRNLRAERRALVRRLATASSERALEREARQLGLVRAGERLFIVKGIEQWRRAHASPARR